MIEIKVSSPDVMGIMNALSGHLNVPIQEDCQKSTVSIPHLVGEGEISAFQFQNGLEILILQCILNEGLKISFPKNNPHPLNLHFCKAGKFEHHLHNDSLFYQLNSLSVSISSNPASSSQYCLFPKGKELVHLHVIIHRHLYLSKIECDLEYLPKAIAEVFRDAQAQRHFLYQSDYSMDVAGCMQDILNEQYEGLIQASFVESKVLELLSLQLHQYTEETDPVKSASTLRQCDLNAILAARDILLQDLDNAPIIVELSKKVGINQQKLKQGFKAVFGESIYKYLQKARLETAKILIEDGGLPVGDAASKVGYTNKSHFARQFKRQYGLLPSALTRKALPSKKTSSRTLESVY
ncbi:MAG TPA: AraC family transcriptional regulator [Saprospiraceae bacterium]|nr:AraC family transcriptional regulator [Saprospiraceae bacterium]HMQ81866.1 AraC family transcriptional regulator [Saprospiraceae bacterium]